MIAEVISFGDELTSGLRLDTNSRWLSERLGELGLRVLFHTTAPDDLTAAVQVCHTAIARADVIVTTGGLGPTADDLTREAIAEVVGRKLVRDEHVLAHIRELFARRGRPMPPRNVVQAMFPIGSCVIPNHDGTAPGIDQEIPRGERQPARIFALPGVPVEMRVMFNQSVAPSILTMGGAERLVLRHRRIHCFGAGESEVEQMLPHLVRRGRDPAVGITASKTTITLRITAAGEQLLCRHTPISGEAASAAAESCRRQFSTDFGLAIGAFPAVDSTGGPSEHVFLALSTPAGVHAKSTPYTGHPDMLTIRIAKGALNFMRLTLIEE